MKANCRGAGGRGESNVAVSLMEQAGEKSLLW